MNEPIMHTDVTEEKYQHTSSLLLTKRLEQLGYECLSDSCDRFTTLRLVPIEIKRKEEQPNHSSE